MQAVERLEREEKPTAIPQVTKYSKRTLSGKRSEGKGELNRGTVSQ
jgi:hypothetical protein